MEKYDTGHINQLLHTKLHQLAYVRTDVVKGRLVRINGMTLESRGCMAPIGARCLIENDVEQYIESEVVGFSGDRLYLIPTQSVNGLKPNAAVIPDHRPVEYPIDDNLLGRIIDAKCSPIDDGPPLNISKKRTLHAVPRNPLKAKPVSHILDVGIRSINSLLTIGRGQRIGLFAGSGVGKSVLLGMMTRFTNADVIVIGLIGERGREVNEFVQQIINDDALSRTVVVAVPADQSPVMRVNGANLATSIAEYFREQGKHVLLLMDSLTRFAQAHREISLSIGEPPVARGYPASVYAKLPQLIERSGNSSTGEGSITAFYTVLLEDEIGTDPVGDTSKAILDGHIVLTRELAEKGHYPAIDVEASISRVMNQVITDKHLNLAQQFRKLYSKYMENRDLVMVGAYARGSDVLLDTALEKKNDIDSFLQQNVNESVSYQDGLDELHELLQHTDANNRVLNIPI